jgi:electron transfer flavoprotein alpha subunit
MPILVIAEHRNGALSDTTARLVGAAMLMDQEIDLLLAGRDIGALSSDAARLGGVRKVLHADDETYERPVAEDLAALIVSIAGSYSAILAAATTTGKNILPRVAALLDVMQVSDVVAIVSPNIFKRPIYAGNAIQTVQATDGKIVATIRTTAFEPVGDGGSATVEAIAPPAPRGLTRVTSVSSGTTDRLDLGAAKIVVSGGRALGSAAQFDALLQPLAEKLGAAIGASRAAVDAGYAPNELQVGQTGRIVAPELYIAVGISGAIQHVAGMQSAKVIVAVNNDPEAPIFRVADYGLVADIFEAIPELTDKL